MTKPDTTAPTDAERADRDAAADAENALRTGRTQSDDGIKRIDIAEFRRLGFLQEVNRRFLHPLGLALEVAIEEDGTETLGGIWDYRDDPEGIAFGAGGIDPVHIAAVEAERDRHASARIALFGAVVQPVAP